MKILAWKMKIMGKEILTVPEEEVCHVITVIRNGLANTQDNSIPIETKLRLKLWCDEYESYYITNNEKNI